MTRPLAVYYENIRIGFGISRGVAPQHYSWSILDIVGGLLGG